MGRSVSDSWVSRMSGMRSVDEIMRARGGRGPAADFEDLLDSLRHRKDE